MIKQRMCISCRNRGNKDDLIKISLINDSIVLDKEHKINGRSCYICKNKDCISKTIKLKLINRVFKRQVDNEIYNSIKNNYEVNGD